MAEIVKPGDMIIITVPDMNDDNAVSFRDKLEKWMPGVSITVIQERNQQASLVLIYRPDKGKTFHESLEEFNK